MLVSFAGGTSGSSGLSPVRRRSILILGITVTQTRRLIHPYSDLPDCATDIRVVALEEARADKLKCLLQRRSSFDLFDLVYSIFVNNDIAVDRLAVVATFLKKTIFQASPGAAMNLLLGVPLDVMRHYWNTKIVCAKGKLLDFATAVEQSLRRSVPGSYSDPTGAESSRIRLHGP